MDAIHPPKSPVSRETRLLFITILIALVTLWALARLRFTDRAVANPVTPVLTQLAPPPVFEQISTALSHAGIRMASQVVPVELRNPPSRGGATRVIPALILEPGLVLAILSPAQPLRPAEPMVGGTLIARDPASGLSIVNLSTGTPPSAGALSGQPIWSPRQPQHPRFLMAAEASAAELSARPVFVGALRPAASAVWGAAIWAMPESAGVAAGSFLFTADGVLAGVVVDSPGGLMLVPGSTLRDLAERLRTAGRREYGQLGVEVQPAPREAVSPGSADSLIVTWVDPRGPASAILRATDAIATVGGQPANLAEWEARTLRLAVGDWIDLGVGRGGVIESVRLTAAPPWPAATPTRLGLSLRTVRRTGVEVLRVEPGSAAAQAGIRAGDLITAFRGRQSPTSAEVTRLFAAPPPDEPVLVALTRGVIHEVAVIRTR